MSLPLGHLLRNEGVEVIWKKKLSWFTGKVFQKRTYRPAAWSSSSSFLNYFPLALSITPTTPPLKWILLKIALRWSMCTIFRGNSGFCGKIAKLCKIGVGGGGSYVEKTGKKSSCISFSWFSETLNTNWERFQRFERGWRGRRGGRVYSYSESWRYSFRLRK